MRVNNSENSRHTQVSLAIHVVPWEGGLKDETEQEGRIPTANGFGCHAKHTRPSWALGLYRRIVRGEQYGWLCALGRSASKHIAGRLEGNSGDRQRVGDHAKCG